MLSELSRLTCLRLGGWVCEVTLAHALQQLPRLSDLELGEDLGSLQARVPVLLAACSCLQCVCVYMHVGFGNL